MAKKWTAKDYRVNAEEFVSCYGADHDWAAFLSDYMALFEPGEPRPDVDRLEDAIYEAIRANPANVG